MLSYRDSLLRSLPPDGAHIEPPPDDLMFDILLRLPTKTLFLCKLVCRPWRSMMEDPLFISEHLKRSALRCSTAHTHLIRRWDREKGKPKLVIASVLGRDSVRLLTAVEVPPNTYQHRWNDKIVGSCNGVVCVSRCWRGKLFTEADPDRWQAYLWNPTTREYRALPEGSMCRNSTRLVYGFGYHPMTGDYKVVRFTVHFDLTRRSRAEVFSLNDGSWREVCAPDNRIGLQRDSHTWSRLREGRIDYAQVDGVLYWVALYGDDRREQILSFDLGSEEFRSADLPRFSDNGCRYRKLTAYKNTLCFIVPRSEYDECFNIWAMNASAKCKIEGAWTRLATIGPFIQDMKPLGFGINGELFMERVADTEVIVYESRTRRTRGLYFRHHGYSLPFDFHFYTESLVPLAPTRLRTFL